jgi:hypothetical protein
MKTSVSGFLCADDVRLIIGDPHEMVLFLQTACAAAGVDPYTDDLFGLIEALDEQVKARFSDKLQVTAIDADTMTPATKRSEEVGIAISSIEDITVH